MTTAISATNTKGLFIDNCRITGFENGITGENSEIFLNNTIIDRCNVALGLTNSDAIVHNSRFMDNAIDIVVNRSKVHLIDTIAYKIIAEVPRSDYRINPYTIINMTNQIINTRDIQEKKNRLRQLLKYLKNYTHIWAIYSILKEIMRLSGYSF